MPDQGLNYPNPVIFSNSHTVSVMGTWSFTCDELNRLSLGTTAETAAMQVPGSLYGVVADWAAMGISRVPALRAVRS